MSSLYELSGEFLQVQEMLENDEFDQEAVKNTLDCIDFEIDLKAENYAKIIKNLEVVKAGIKGKKDAIEEELERLDCKEKNIENKIKYLKECLGQAMKATGKEKIKTDLFSFYFKKNQAVRIVDEKIALESNFVRIKKEIDRKELLKAMKEGQNFDFAEIKESESLIIR